MQFDEVYTTYFSAVYRYVLRLSGSADVAEEIASETFFRALRAIDSFRGECSLSSWLCQIAKNCYFSYAKRAGRIDPLDDGAAALLPDPAPSLEDAAIVSAEALRIRETLRELPEPYRSVFSRRVFDELPFEAIGALFGKTANWACVTYHRARKKIKDRMEEEK